MPAPRGKTFDLSIKLFRPAEFMQRVASAKVMLLKSWARQEKQPGEAYMSQARLLCRSTSYAGRKSATLLSMLLHT